MRAWRWRATSAWRARARGEGRRDRPGDHQLGGGGDGGREAHDRGQLGGPAHDPSVVAFTKTGDQLVGQIAKRQGVVNPENTFFSVKRFIGRRMDEVNEELKQVPYEVFKDGGGNVKIR